MTKGLRIVLTGATGFLGSRTLEKLVHRSDVETIVACGRTLRESHKIDHPKINYMLGDLCDPFYVKRITENTDLIVHAAALSSPWGKAAEFIEANVVPQQLLIDAAHRNKIQRFIYISTPSLYFDSTNRFNIKETDPLPKRFVNQYAKTKRDAELLLEQSGLPYVILRPRALTGRGDTVIMPRLVRAFDEGRLKMIGNGKNIADLTSVENAVDAILLSLDAKGEALNQTYNISNGEPVELWSSIEQVLGLMGKKMPQKKIPRRLVLFIARMMELKSKLTHYREPALTVYGVGTLTRSVTLDISKAKKLLKYDPKVSTAEAIQEFVTWYKNENR